MPDPVTPKPKPWWRSRRFWFGVSTLIGGGGSVCNLVAGGNRGVAIAAAVLTATSLALRYWFGEKDGLTAVAYPKGTRAVGESLNRIDAARGARAKLAQVKAEISGNGNGPK